MKRQKQKTLLCMDLEGTLISNAVSQIPRPGLYAFLESVAEVCDLMLYTSVSPVRVNAIRNLLVNEGAAPAWFLELSVCHPSGTIKHKAHCGRYNALLLDDQAAVIAPGEDLGGFRLQSFCHLTQMMIVSSLTLSFPSNLD